MTIAFHTLGCKVNQYDTQAMRELFERAGYREVGFGERADAYLINTCTVTGVGDSKALKLIRRARREHPDARLIVCGCLAQRDAERVALPGVCLILGTRNRARVVELFERALREDLLINAVEGESNWTFEALHVSRHEGRTRAVLKIQEGCDRYCAYCVIPYVRGAVRSMPLAELEREARRLTESGYVEIVLTGIHLASYGRGLTGSPESPGRETGIPLAVPRRDLTGRPENPRHSAAQETSEAAPVGLLDAIRTVHALPGVSRVRLGSLEPTLITEEFAEALAALPKLCPQFHLSLQSGSASVLARMRRRYTPDEYEAAARRLRDAFPDCALTTDILTGFPGETEAEADETLAFVRKLGFARIHVFPYSRRAGTLADTLPDQAPEPVKRRRAAALIELGDRLEAAYVQSLVGTRQEVLFEKRAEEGSAEGYSRQYVRVLADAEPGELRAVLIESAARNSAFGRVIEAEKPGGL